MAILTELRDPRISDVTVTFVEVSPDMRHAKVHVSIMGDEAKQQLAVRGLQNAAGFLQQKIARRIDTRYTPRLRFVLDPGVKHAMEVSRILSEVLPRDDAGERRAGGRNRSGSARRRRRSGGGRGHGRLGEASRGKLKARTHLETSPQPRRQHRTPGCHTETSQRGSRPHSPESIPHLLRKRGPGRRSKAAAPTPPT